MIPILAKITQKNNHLTARVIRLIKKKLKSKILPKVADTWIERFLPKHFTREAYSRYPGIHEFIKRGIAKPLVDTGNLRKNILSGQNIKIRPKSNRVDIKMLYGRPVEFNFSRIDKFAEMISAQRGITIQDARRAVFKWKASKGGYDLKTKLRFQDELTATNKQEIGVFTTIILKGIKAFFDEPGQIETLRIR